MRKAISRVEDSGNPTWWQPKDIFPGKSWIFFYGWVLGVTDYSLQGWQSERSVSNRGWHWGFANSGYLFAGTKKDIDQMEQRSSFYWLLDGALYRNNFCPADAKCLIWNAGFLVFWETGEGYVWRMSEHDLYPSGYWIVIGKRFAWDTAYLGCWYLTMLRSLREKRSQSGVKVWILCKNLRMSLFPRLMAK